ncbi:uncharacterized protein LOC135848636 [Planococcus citri]|uniref:uncharacterized protein LOC135848636 n=1 Tax=Planococcus citri TaxID=170843 RepID=UPI0031F7A912
MAEIACDVYDIFHPTLVSLKELSAITVSLEIWRSQHQVIKSRTCDTSENSDFFLPDLPSTIRNIIDEFRTRFSLSMDHWKRSHYERIFQFHRNCQNSVLEDFDDFVADFNGNIHYVRTAERMMHSDRLSEVEKFKIACTYFFEDDIRRIWPSVCESFDLKDFRIGKCPQVYYWICCLRNQSDKSRIPSDEQMLDDCMPYKRPSVQEYFWARLPLESQLRNASDLYQRDVVSFVLFILPKLDDRRLNEFVNTEASKLMIGLLKSGYAYEWLWLPTWMYIKNKINQITVKNVVVEMLRLESGAFVDHLKSEPENWLDFCSAFWNSIPSDWKPSMVEDILSYFRFYVEAFLCSDTINGLSCIRLVTFLLIILSSAPSEQKRDFWHNCWRHLIKRTRCEDLRKIMKLCFNNEDEIAQFIDNKMATSDRVLIVCIKLLKEGDFNQLNEWINFYYPETRKGMNFKQQQLRTTLYLENKKFQWTQRIDHFYR